MMHMKHPVVIVEHWPSVPGRSEQTITRRGWCKGRSEDNAFWLVKERGLFRRWRWRPRRGMFVTIREVEGRG